MKFEVHSTTPTDDYDVAAISGRFESPGNGVHATWVAVLPVDMPRPFPHRLLDDPFVQRYLDHQIENGHLRKVRLVNAPQGAGGRTRRRIPCRCQTAAVQIDATISP